jgi:hypothetical protein
MKFFILIFLLLTGISAQTQDKSLTVISNQVGPPSQMKLIELKSVFMAERQRWSDGTKIIIALMKLNTEIGANVCEKIYGMSGDKVKRYLLGLEFQQQINCRVFDTVNDLQAFVADNPGAIGIIDQFQPTPNLKAILIDGKKSF